MRFELRTGRIFGTIALALLLTVPAHAQRADRSLEYAVKATFLYKFASFVEWPQGSFEHEASPFNLCVVGNEPFGGRIRSAVAGQSVGRHPIVLVQLSRAEARGNCHAMFIAGSRTQSVREALDVMRGTPVLTITDQSISPAAGVVHFVIADDRVSFDIDDIAAARSGLTVSSKLLALARRVRTARPGAVR